MASIMASIAAGDKFGSFHEFSARLKQYEKEKYAQFYVRDSRSIESSAKRAPNRTFNPNLKYAELLYACINGGKTFKSSSTGKRPRQS